MTEEQTRKPRDVRSLKGFIVAGDSAPASLQERFKAAFGFRLREAFGMSEVGGCISNFDDDFRVGALGKALEGVELRIVDANGQDVPDSQSGEIIVRSPGCFIGYWNNPKATAETLREGWLYTGDLGHRDPDGYIWFEARKKAIIVHGGSNISPQEVEAALHSHPAVLEAAVVGQPVPVYGERVVAFVSLREGLTTTEQQLKDHTRKHLADIKVPQQIVLMSDLPKSAGGKVNKRLLKDMAISA